MAVLGHWFMRLATALRNTLRCRAQTSAPSFAAPRHLAAQVWALVLLLSVGTATAFSATTAPLAKPSAKPPTVPATPGAVADPTDGGGTDPRIPTFFEQGSPFGSGEVIKPLGVDLMGDGLNEFSGGLSFTQTDVSLAGNNALSVAVGRQLSTGTRQAALGAGHFGDWDLDIPRLHTVAIFDNPNWYGRTGVGAFNLNRCSELAEPPRSSYTAGNKTVGLPAFSWWNGYKLYVPGAGDQTLFRRVSSLGVDTVNPIQPTDGVAYPVLTKQHWQLSCLPVMERGAGQGFVALSPDGTRYKFDHMVQRDYPALDTFRYGTRPRIEFWILPTEVTDRFGNWVRYTYTGTDGFRVASITSSDGRTISFTYNGWGNRIQSVTDGTRIWRYGYDTGGALQTVTQPDGSQWRFALSDLLRDPFSIEDPGCGTNLNARWDPYTHSGTIVHPSGATGTFTLQMTLHGRTNVPGSEAACEGPSVPAIQANRVSRYFASYSLIAKTLSGPGMPATTWQYAYSSAVGSFAPSEGSKTVTVTEPNGRKALKTFGTKFGVNDGLLLTVSEGDGSTMLRTTSYAYASSGPFPSRVGYEGGVSDSMGAIYRPMNQRTITQQGVAFVRSINSFDEFARPTSLVRANGLGFSRSETISYFDQRNLWVLGQISGRTVAGLQAEATSFNAASALPSTSFKFGRPVASYQYRPDGTLASVTDALNHTTSFTDWKRGLPQKITYADGTSTSAAVNNIGLLTSITNEVNTTWQYGYDAMGRLASKTPPADAGVAYHPTVLAFEQVPVAEWGLEPNHWRQTITTGSAVTIHYFDARWRKRLTTTYDASDRAGTERAQRFDYDAYNQTTFASYPARTIGTTTAGTATTYDVLGRPMKMVAHSELGLLQTSIDYLPNFQRRTTNPRGFATVQSFHAWDGPSDDTLSTIWAPEGATTGIERDVFGKPISITRAGGGASVTRRYVYDSYQRLCKTIEPESGATVVDYDAADNVVWRASGQSLLGLTCDRGSVPAGSKVSHGYDLRNRLTSTAYGDGSPGIGRSYTADGQPYQVWTPAFAWTYDYNKRRLLVGETLARSGASDGIGWSINAYGHVGSIRYPDGETLVYAPNALGQPTRVGGYASAVSHHPNGAVAGYVLGNGIQHEVVQNTRGLPQLWRDAGVVRDRYSYDPNGNVVAIGDEQLGTNNRAMGYDGLDRLTAANGPWGAGTYRYDALDNLVGSALGGRVLTHDIEPLTNRLRRLTGSQDITIQYDANGNATARGAQLFDFDIGNRLKTARNKAIYQYDGHGRRALTTYADGASQLSLYSQSGQLLRTAHTTKGTTKHIYLGNKLIAEVNSLSGVSYTHADALGSPVAQTSSGALLLGTTGYEPYGAVATGRTPAGIGFTGHVNDADTGLVYMQQRYYDPLAGRFLSVDPVVTDGKAGGHFGRYHYANNNPYLYVDPDGRAASSGGGFGFGWQSAGCEAGSCAASTSASIVVSGPVNLAFGARVAAQLEGEFKSAGRGALNFAKAVIDAVSSPFRSEGANSEGGGQRTVDDLIGESTAGRETKGRADQYIHGGGREQRDKDFDSLGATDVKDRGNGTKTGTLPDGRPVNVHDSKNDGVPTIQIGNGSREIKIRYP